MGDEIGEANACTCKDRKSTEARGWASSYPPTRLLAHPWGRPPTCRQVPTHACTCARFPTGHGCLVLRLLVAWPSTRVLLLRVTLCGVTWLVVLHLHRKPRLYLPSGKLSPSGAAPWPELHRGSCVRARLRPPHLTEDQTDAQGSQETAHGGGPSNSKVRTHLRAVPREEQHRGYP